MERKDYLKILVCCCCGVTILFCSAPSVAWENQNGASKNWIVNVIIFSIPDTFSPGQMAFSYHGLAGKGKASSSQDFKAASLGGKIMGRIMRNDTDAGIEKFYSEKSYSPPSLNGRIHKMGAFLLRYINVGESALTNAGGEPNLSSSDLPRDQKISLEFQSSPSNFSGAILFTLNL